MPGPRRKFTREYKLAAIAPVIQGVKGGTEVARELGISHTLISRWCSEFLASPVESFPGNGNEPETLKELARLKRENERLAGELDILKKAISIFSKGPR